MKQCPTCKRTYDNSLSFCLMDGTSLVSESDEEKTVVMQQLPTRKKSKFLLWLGLVGLVVLAGICLLVGALFYAYTKQSSAVQEKKQIGVNVSSSPKLSPMLKVSPVATSERSSPVEESSPQITEGKPKPDNKDTEDITPIDWDTNASGFKGEAGQTYTFRCPEEGIEHIIYGSDIYTQDSSICTAAVHAGIISLAKGGTVTIEYRPGRSVYGSTVRNGIKSRTWGEYPRSFVVR